MRDIELAVEEAIAIQRLARSLCRRYGSTDSEALLNELPVHVRQLPARVREVIASAMTGPTSDALIVRGHVIVDDDLGPTPQAWKTEEATRASLEHEMTALLYGGALGSVFGWATQQRGHIVNDVVPIAQHADAQIGASSKVELAWHTEDAFHPGRADFICLYCLRNPTQAPTTVSSLPEILRRGQPEPALFQPCVQIDADDAQAAGAAEIDERDWSEDGAGAVPILIDTPAGMEMRIDPAYMSVSHADQATQQAVRDFCQVVDDHLTDVVLGPGDLLIIDNRRTVHGRRPFRASYDGRDRWLKRVNVAERFETRLPYCYDDRRRLLA